MKKTNKNSEKKQKIFWILLIAAVILILLFLLKSMDSRERKDDKRYIRNKRTKIPRKRSGGARSENAHNVKAQSAKKGNAEFQNVEKQNAKVWNGNMWDGEFQNAEERNAKVRNSKICNEESQNAKSRDTEIQGAEIRAAEIQSAVAWDKREAPDENRDGKVRDKVQDSRFPEKDQDKTHTKTIQKIAYGFYLIIVLGICALPLLAMGAAGWQGETENGLALSLPKIYEEEDGLQWDYLSEAGEYFNGHFAFRSELVALDSYVKTAVFGVSPVNGVIAGKDGWLYYTATLDDFWHKNPASDRMLFNIAHNISLMQRYTESLGMKFIFTVAPNKNSLYCENMPSRMMYQVNPESDMDRLSVWLDKEQIHYVDLFRLFEEQDEILYYQRDSHWNQKGAVMVYNALLNACSKEHETYENCRTQIVYDYYGDLNRMLFPTGGKPEQDIRYMGGKDWIYSEGESVEDSLVITQSQEGSQTLLMYRDSFGNSLLPLMAGEYAEAIFSKIVPYTMTDLAVYWPDVVIVEKVERHLPAFAKAPPIMSAPEITLDGEQTAVESDTTFELSKEGSYWVFSGAADIGYISTDSRIFLEVTHADGTKAYEAFCVSLTDDGLNDNGFVLYISEISLSGDLINVKVMTEQDGEIIVLKEEEVYLTNR